MPAVIWEFELAVGVGDGAVEDSGAGVDDAETVIGIVLKPVERP